MHSEIVMTPANRIRRGQVFATDGGVVTLARIVTTAVVGTVHHLAVEITVVAHGVEKSERFPLAAPLPIWARS